MSIKQAIQKVAQAGALSMGVVAASVSRANSSTERTESPDTPKTIQSSNDYAVGQDTESLKQELDFNRYLIGLSDLSIDDNKGIAPDSAMAIGKYATQLNNQLKVAGESLAHRQFVVKGAVDYIFRPLAGNQDISFAGYSLKPNGLRDFWSNSGASLDLSDGLNVVLTYPDSANDSSKPAFIIDVPQKEITRLVQGLSAIYTDLDKGGVIRQAGSSMDQIATMSAEDQKNYMSQLATDFSSGKLESDMNLTPELKSKVSNQISSLIPKEYTISVRESSGAVRPATEKDADMFFDMVQENIMAMHRYGAIDLTQIAAQGMVGSNEEASKDEGFFGRWGRRIKNTGKSIARASVSAAASFVSDDTIRDQIEEKIKPTLVASFNQAVARQKIGDRQDTRSDSLLADNRVLKGDKIKETANSKNIFLTQIARMER